MADKEYIEREAVKEVIKQLSREPAYQHDGEDYYMGVCAVDGEIAMLPASDVVEVRHGKWVPSLHHYGLYMCSECRCSDEKCQPVFDHKNSWKSCPNCGAKMDGKGEG